MHTHTTTSVLRYAEARELAAELGDEQAIALAEAGTARDFAFDGRLADADTWLRRPLERAHRTRLRWALPYITTLAGHSSMLQGRLDGAAQQLDEAMGQCREIADEYALATALGLRGGVSLRQGDLASARGYLLELEGLGSRLAMPPHDALNTLGQLALREGDIGRATAEFSRSLEFTWSGWRRWAAATGV